MHDKPLGCLVFLGVQARPANRARAGARAESKSALGWCPGPPASRSPAPGWGWGLGRVKETPVGGWQRHGNGSSAERGSVAGSSHDNEGEEMHMGGCRRAANESKSRYSGNNPRRPEPEPLACWLSLALCSIMFKY